MADKMATSGGNVIVPSEPSNACFKREDFLKNSFSVDSFVSTYKGIVSLDILKQDLEEYLKSLKHALIELINQDYADFVNLSTNLVGMDKNINNLSVPLGQLKEEVLMIRTELDETIASIEGKLDARSQLRHKKICMQHLLNITKSLEKIERLLHGSLADEPTTMGNEGEDESYLIERVASEFNQLQFYVTQSQGHPLVESIRSRIAAITMTLQKKLETAFQDGIQSGQFDLLARVLRTYAIIDKIRDAELLFRQVVVKPYMNEAITEHALLSDPVNGLKNIYVQVLEFIPKYCTNMIQITSGRFDDSSKGEQRTAIRGYDFIVNAVWPEVVELIEGRLSSIFAPGNPDAFHKRYTTSMWFVERFESLCSSQTSVRRLRNHNSFSSFMTHWSLPVYFQIRFQEIAGKIETVLETPNVEVEGQYKTSVVNALWWGLETCWQETVYITALSNRFWKLTLQMISRFNEWLSTDALSSVQDDGDASRPQTSYFVYLLNDINALSNQIPKLFKETIEPKIISAGLLDHINVFTDALQESLSKMKADIPTLEEAIIQQVVKNAIAGLDTARNIPRLYRRTNKEVPNKASPFVAVVTKPLQDFQEEYKDLISQDQFQSWSSKVLQTVFEKYSSITSDVLTSIKKTEDSLLRLKRTRKGGSTTTNNQDNPGTMSDDDKIRLQFALDVEEFKNMMRLLKVTEESCPAFKDLATMVQAARSGTTQTT